MRRHGSRWVGLAAALSAALTLSLHAQTPPSLIGQPLPAWQPGMLDIHQIATGQGNSAFMEFPDGTTLLFDAGDAGPTEFADPKPNATKTPGQWIARYVRHMLEGRDAKLDYAALSHFHPDHMGRIAGTEPMSTKGGYRLSGLTAVLDDLPIGELIDRGYTYLPPPNDAMFTNYQKFIADRTAAGTLKVVHAEAGRADLIVPVHNKSAAPGFEVRIISVNDHVWTGEGTATTVRFPALASIAVPEDKPTENMCSVTMRIKYGAFDFFTGGDMPGYPTPGGPAWHDLESAVAKAIGPTDVHVMNHHGSIEVANPTWLSTLKSQVMILPAWQATHPSPDVLKRMLSPRIYSEPHDIFITEFRDATKATIGARAKQVASDHGHVVVRVEPGGAKFWVFVLDDTTESYKVISMKGPYTSK